MKPDGGGEDMKKENQAAVHERVGADCHELDFVCMDCGVVVVKRQNDETLFFGKHEPDKHSRSSDSTQEK